MEAGLSARGDQYSLEQIYREACGSECDRKGLSAYSWVLMNVYYGSEQLPLDFLLKEV